MWLKNETKVELPYFYDDSTFVDVRPIAHTMRVPMYRGAVGFKINRHHTD